MSSPSPTKTSILVRGGQAAQHWWRMALQVLLFAVITAFIVYSVTVAVVFFWYFDAAEMRIAFYYELAEFNLRRNPSFAGSYQFEDLSGRIRTMSVIEFYRDPILRSTRDEVVSNLIFANWIGVYPGGISFVVSFVIFIITGNKIQDDMFIRGAKLVSHRDLRRYSKLKWKAYVKQFKGRKKAPRYEIAGVQFPPNAVEAQTAIVGTVGVGKTTIMLDMLDKIRDLGGRAVVYDRTGAFVRKYYDPETDIIINPFDNRSHSWQLFSDVTDVASLSQIAEVMIPHSSTSSDPFWSNAARVVLEYAAREIITHKPDATNADLRKAILELSVEQLERLLASTPGSQFFNSQIEKTALSIRANMISDLKFLEFMRDDGEPFSMRHWIKADKPSILFLAADAEHDAATRAINSTIAEIGVNALMSCGQSTDPRVFFFIDELPSLNKMPFLTRSLAQVRQFGGAFVLGYQVFSQLEDTYGKEAAQTISGTVNNRIVFNTPDFKTAEHCSEALGKIDQIERTNSIVVGSEKQRDGTSFQQNRQERPLVSASEIMNLPQLEAYLRFAYDAPVAKVTIELKDRPDVARPFEAYIGNGFQLNILARAAPVHSDDALVALDGRKRTVNDVATAFYVWASREFSCTQADWVKDRGRPPSDIEVYWPHFAKQFLAGTHLENIKPFVEPQGLLGAPKDQSTDEAIPSPWRSEETPTEAQPAPSPASKRKRPIGKPKPPARPKKTRPQKPANTQASSSWHQNF